MKRPRRIAALAERGFTPTRGLRFPYARLLTATMVREARKTRPTLPILFMSGYAEEQLRKSIDIENVAFLPKPFSVKELAEAVRKALAGN